MEKNILKETISNIDKWCFENNIATFYGSIDESSLTEVSWTKSQDTDWQKYLEASKRIGAKVIIVDVTINETDTDNEEFIAYKESLEGADLREYEVALKVVEKNKGHTVYFDLCFISDNVCYKYTHEANWIDDYILVLDAIGFMNDDDDDDGENRSFQIERLSDEQIEEHARKIIANKKYQSAATPAQRSEVAETLIRQENLPHSIWAVKRRINSLYEEEIKPKQEAEMRKKVLELKKQGLKKVQIGSKLNISSRMVDKYYHAD